MPITVFPFPPFNGIGPGISFEVQTDFIGPFPTGTRWDTQVLDVETGSELVGQHTTFVENPQVIKLFDPLQTQFHVGEAFASEGQTIRVTHQLVQPPTTILDTGVTTMPWSSTVGQHIFIQDWAGKSSVQLNPAQSAQLEAIDNRTTAVLGNDAPTITDNTGAHAFTLGELFSGKALDQITLTEVSPGPTPGPVTSALANWMFGVIVRITAIPSNAVPLTPDQDWFPFDLAVLRVFRGTDMEQRYGIHNTSFLQTFHNLYGGVVLNETLLFGNPPDTSIEVEFAQGVEGQVFLMLFP